MNEQIDSPAAVAQRLDAALTAIHPHAHARDDGRGLVVIHGTTDAICAASDAVCAALGLPVDPENRSLFALAEQQITVYRVTMIHPDERDPHRESGIQVSVAPADADYLAHLLPEPAPAEL